MSGSAIFVYASPRPLRAGIKKTALAAEFHGELTQELGSLPRRQPPEELDFEALEMAARRAVLGWAARLVRDWLNADDSDRRHVAVPCRCGHPTRYVDRRRKRIQSALGELQLERACYHCPRCAGQDFVPTTQCWG